MRAKAEHRCAGGFADGSVADYHSSYTEPPCEFTDKKWLVYTEVRRNVEATGDDAWHDYEMIDGHLL